MLPPAVLPAMRAMRVYLSTGARHQVIAATSTRAAASIQITVAARAAAATRVAEGRAQTQKRNNTTHHLQKHPLRLKLTR